MKIGMLKFVGDGKKFLGKVFRLMNYIDAFDGHLIHYRAEKTENLLTRKHENAIGLDVDAWDCAREHGAEFMAVYLLDKKKFIIVDAATVNASPVSELPGGEGLQYRVPNDEFKVFMKAPNPPKTPFIDDNDCINLKVWAKERKAVI
jgi:hypothetical protein